MDVVGWVSIGLAAWVLVGFPLAVVVGRRLRDRQPPRDDCGS